MNRFLRTIALTMPLAAAALPAFAAPSGAMMVSDCWIRSMPGDTPSGGYFKLMNSKRRFQHTACRHTGS